MWSRVSVRFRNRRALRAVGSQPMVGTRSAVLLDDAQAEQGAILVRELSATAAPRGCGAAVRATGSAVEGDGDEPS